MNITSVLRSSPDERQPVESVTANPTAASGRKSRYFGLLERRWLLGTVAGMIWFAIFSAGILIDSLPHRVALGWKKEATKDEAEIGRLAQQVIATSELPAQGTTASSALATTPAQHRTASAVEVLSQVIADQSKRSAADRSQITGFRHTAYHFICGMLLFTPTNVALLALLAGFIGGCSSNESDRTSLKKDLEKAESSGDELSARPLRRKIHFLEEHPAYSMMRSFIVYLVFISGIYIASSDPFNSGSQAQGFTQYIRLAGLVSLLGFMVGYDPTRFEQWLALVPSPAPTKTPTPVSPAEITVTKEVAERTKISVPIEPSPATQEKKKQRSQLPGRRP